MAWFKNGLTLWAENADDLIFQRAAGFKIQDASGHRHLVSIASCELSSWKVWARHASPLLNREMNHPFF